MKDFKKCCVIRCQRPRARVLIKTKNIGEVRLRAEVNPKAQMVGNVASRAAERTEQFPSRVLRMFPISRVLSTGICVPPWVSAEKEGGMIFEFIAK